ncbi:hypothetical protein AX17_000684 [Amanita inopinata Kibby_2008]|nr:hypothetical protein AX17_000684 [Amanita inopinata Kibby_2008]
MFRCIEAVYKANRSLYSKLKDIGTNPSSPKALGDLLMRWVDDLDGPYTNYCTKYCCGFDEWEPVKSNAKLPNILNTFSATIPPPSSERLIWTLDDLFLLPQGRLKYYRKLYSWLLKSTAPGRSDYRLLVGALEKLDVLLGIIESRQSIQVGQSVSSRSSMTRRSETNDQVVIDLRWQNINSDGEPSRLKTHAAEPNEPSEGDNVHGTNRLSEEMIPRSSRESFATLKMPITELERRLSTERTLDIFTMNRKAVRLQMLPPNLIFTREMRLSLDVVIRFTPRATNTEVTHHRGHIFLLSDLFLICERITPEERVQHEADGADMWLCYPPLAGKVLRASEVEGQARVLQVAVMKKEFLMLEAASENMRDVLMGHLKDCIEFSASLPPPSKQPPPPVPPLNKFLDKDVNSDSDQVQNPPFNRAVTSVAFDGSEHSDHSNAPYSQQHEQWGHMPHSMYQGDQTLISNTSNTPEPQSHQGSHVGPAQNPIPDPMYPRTSLLAQPLDFQPRLIPGQNMSQHASYFGNPRMVPHSGSGVPPMGYGHSIPVLPQEYSMFPPERQPPPQQQQRPTALPPGMYAANGLPPRLPSVPGTPQGVMRKSISMRSLATQYSQQERFPPPPPIPAFGGDYPVNGNHFMPRTGSVGNIHVAFSRPLLPSAQMSSRATSVTEPSFDEPSPPGSPVAEAKLHLGPVTSTISAQMKCKVFLQQQHAQWKSFGSAKLKLYRQSPTNIKQLVVESEKDNSVLISTIVLTDGVERVGKTGVAIELSDHGARTGTIYMLQLRNEKSAGGLFDSLLAGSDRSQ